MLIIAVFILLPTNNNCIVANGKPVSNPYGKVLYDCKLYFNTSLENQEYLFIIPESYFVMILDSSNSEYFKVQYKNYIGFALKNKIEICNFIPEVKFLDGITFDIKLTSGTQIWSNPSDLSNKITTISAGTLNIEYIAAAYGDIPLGGVSNLWYYVKYTSAEFSTNVYEGYIYSENTTNLSPIKTNIESNVRYTSNVSNNELRFANGTIKTIIVSVIAIPIILFLLFIMYKIAKIIQKKTDKYKNTNNYVSDNIETSNENENLKNEIDKLKNEKFIKKRKCVNKKEANYPDYPEFPSYENDDDWL